jgi:hypothetical protein
MAAIHGPRLSRNGYCRAKAQDWLVKSEKGISHQESVSAKTSKVQVFLDDHPNVDLHLTPTYSS